VPIFELGLIAILGLVSGLMIGWIGGVILVPSLVFLADVPIHVSIPAAMMAYILSGLVATTVFARKKSIEWPMAIWLCSGAIPTAFIGAWTVNVLNPRILEVCIGFLTLLAGLNALTTQAGGGAAARAVVPKTTLGVVGAIAGFLSSLSGTGGPLVLVPILITMSVPVLTAVGLSQAIQLPIATAATFGNALYGTLNLELGGVLALALTFGSWGGARLAHVMPRTILRKIVSVVLVVVGLFILGNILFRLMR
jgi:uncharacterized membrane protein YfcA